MSKIQRYKVLGEKLKKYRKNMKLCKKCEGDGSIPTGKFVDDITMEYKDCECKKEFIKIKEYILSGVPKKKLSLLSQKTKNVKVINTLTDERVSLYKLVVNTYIKKFDDAKKDGLGLMFFGSTGNGKTTSSLYILMNLVDLGYDCYYVYFKDLIGLLIEGYSDQDKSLLFKEIIGVDFLVVDELSLVGRVTPHMIAEFTSICKQRFEEEKPTLLISNYKTTDDLFHNFGAPLESLMNEAFAPFKFVGKDIREDKYEEMKRFFE